MSLKGNRQRVADVLKSIADGSLVVRVDDDDPSVFSTVVFAADDGTRVYAYFDGGPDLDYIESITFPDGTELDYDDFSSSFNMEGDATWWPDDEPWFDALSDRLWRAIEPEVER